ncbi:uncharacterized protein SCHCODRAFT_02253712 [Schizophyllum commune H4-8]|uniref:uncharacterized protein n=1 Tax=Schizophyllum commune (strain H4-8 / FGSC 9210) TaxID=578458 RepID=UPI00215FEBD2|nr:uncharacterized protein SCHCODRAFT_02253712 [Schizophyllum commune H4-8]KAI5893450.1 hypothetical protein SCHCODRAFT_02253712 [Schizophyllum commune H4-8]
MFSRQQGLQSQGFLLPTSTARTHCAYPDQSLPLPWTSTPGLAPIVISGREKVRPSSLVPSQVLTPAIRPQTRDVLSDHCASVRACPSTAQSAVYMQASKR